MRFLLSYCFMISVVCCNDSPNCGTELFLQMFGENHIFLPSNVGYYVVAMMPFHHKSDITYSSGGATCSGRLDPSQLWMSEMIQYARSEIPGPKLGFLLVDSCSSYTEMIKTIQALLSCHQPQTTPARKIKQIYQENTVTYIVSGTETVKTLGNQLATPILGLEMPPLISIQIKEQTIIDTARLIDAIGLRSIFVFYSNQSSSFQSFVLLRQQLHHLGATPCVESSIFPPSSAIPNGKPMAFLEQLNTRNDIEAIILLTTMEDTNSFMQFVTASNMISKSWHWFAIFDAVNVSAVPFKMLDNMIFAGPDLQSFSGHLMYPELILGQNPWLTQLVNCGDTNCRREYFSRLINDSNLIFSGQFFYALTLLRVLGESFARVLKVTCSTEDDRDCLLKSEWDTMLRNLTLQQLTADHVMNYTTVFYRISSFNIEQVAIIDENVTVLDKMTRFAKRDVMPKCSSRKRLRPGSSEVDGSRVSYSQIVTDKLVHKTEPWAILLSVLSLLGLVFVIVYELVSLTRICRNLAHANNLLQSSIILGQLLLSGTFLCFLSSLLYVVEPTIYTCGAARVLTGLSYILVFDSLIVKASILLGERRGISLSICFQVTIFVSLFIIQILLICQWLLTNVPNVFVDVTIDADIGDVPVVGFETSTLRCNASLRDLSKYLSYPMFLNLVTFFLSLIQVKNEANFNEALSIAITTIVCALHWVMWLAIGFLLNNHDSENIATAYALLSCGVITFVVMFLPKHRIFAASGVVWNPKPNQDRSTPTNYYKSDSGIPKSTNFSNSVRSDPNVISVPSIMAVAASLTVNQINSQYKADTVNRADIISTLLNKTAINKNKAKLQCYSQVTLDVNPESLARRSNQVSRPTISTDATKHNTEHMNHGFMLLPEIGEEQTNVNLYDNVSCPNEHNSNRKSSFNRTVI